MSWCTLCPVVVDTAVFPFAGFPTATVAITAWVRVTTGTTNAKTVLGYATPGQDDAFVLGFDTQQRVVVKIMGTVWTAPTVYSLTNAWCALRSTAHGARGESGLTTRSSESSPASS